MFNKNGFFSSKHKLKKVVNMEFIEFFSCIKSKELIFFLCAFFFFFFAKEIR